MHTLNYPSTIGAIGSGRAQSFQRVFSQLVQLIPLKYFKYLSQSGGGRRNTAYAKLFQSKEEGKVLRELGCKWHFSRWATRLRHHFLTLPKALSSGQSDRPWQNNIEQPCPAYSLFSPSIEVRFVSLTPQLLRSKKRLLKFLINKSNKTKCSLYSVSLQIPKKLVMLEGKLFLLAGLATKKKNHMLHFPLYRIHIVLIK